MLVDNRDAEYILAVRSHLVAGDIPADALTDRCPECNRVQTASDNHGHLVMRITEDTGDYRIAVVVACEWYWVIDPSLVGMDRGGWMDWRSAEDITTPEDLGI